MYTGDLWQRRDLNWGGWFRREWRFRNGYGWRSLPACSMLDMPSNDSPDHWHTRDRTSCGRRGPMRLSPRAPCTMRTREENHSGRDAWSTKMPTHQPGSRSSETRLTLRHARGHARAPPETRYSPDRERKTPNPRIPRTRIPTTRRRPTNTTGLPGWRPSGPCTGSWSPMCPTLRIPPSLPPRCLPPSRLLCGLRCGLRSPSWPLPRSPASRSLRRLAPCRATAWRCMCGSAAGSSWSLLPWGRRRGRRRGRVRALVLWRGPGPQLGGLEVLLLTSVSRLWSGWSAPPLKGFPSWRVPRPLCGLSPRTRAPRPGRAFWCTCLS